MCLRECDRSGLVKRFSQKQLWTYLTKIVRACYVLNFIFQNCFSLSSYAQAQLDRYKEKSPCASSTQSSASNQSAATSSMYRCVKSSVITQSGGCRVMDFHSRTYQFVVSTPSPHASFMSGELRIMGKC